MARTDARFRAAYNQLLIVLNDFPRNAPLPSELRLADDLKVSRTVVRAVLKRLTDAGIIGLDGRHKTLLRAPTEDDRLPERDDYISLAELEGR
ncbi:MAG: GntR family transcriptional regulator, partial [Rhodobacteraceae bacterium]|nr:GntR family transcriptional regulator [Paracoccaceae bacterium]